MRGLTIVIKSICLLFLLLIFAGCGGGDGGSVGVPGGTPGAPGDTVDPPTPTGQLVFVEIPDEIVPGVPFVVEVALVDESGSLLSNQNLTVVIEATGGILEGSTQAVLSGGRAVFSGLTLVGSGPFTLTVRAGELRAVISVDADLRGIPTQLRFVTQPSDTRVSEPLAPTVAAEVLDVFGNRVVTPVAVSISLQPDGGLTGSLSQTSVNGLVSFAPLAIENPGTYRLTVNALGLTQALSALFRILPPLRFGNFLSRRDFAGSGGTNAMDTGDLNGDGRQDVVRFHPNGLSVSLNQGDGTLPESNTVTENLGFADGELVLLNGDSHLDFVAIEDGGSGVLFLGLGDGNGGFQIVQDGTFGDDVRKLALGDFNEDEVLDVAALLVDGDEVALKLGEGDGTFGTTSILSLSSIGTGREIAAGDFDRDGMLDLVVASGNVEAPEIYFGVGDGSFETPAATLSFSTACTGLSVRDLNGDQSDDIVLARFVPQEDVVVVLGSNTRNFSISSTLPIEEAREVELADVTGDENLDIITGHPDTGIKDRVAVAAGQGNGLFSQVNDFTTAFGEPKLASVDANSDGLNDVITYNPLSGTLSVYTSEGMGDFRIPLETQPLFGNPAIALPGDFDEDGEVDVLLGGSGELLLGQGDGTFIIGPRISPTDSDGASGDLDGDGNLDAVFTDSGSGTILIHFGRGDGTFDTVQVITTVDRPGEIAIVDVNIDGRMDLALESSSQGFVYLLRNSDRTFASPQAISIPARSSTRRLANGFLNDDQYPDFAMANSDFALIILSDGVGGFQTPVEFPTGDTLTDIDLGDLDEDGSIDLALSTFADEDIRVLYNNGNGVFSTPQVLPGWDRMTRVVLSDLNLDGHLDVAGLMDRYSSFVVYYGNGDSTYSAPEVYGVGSDPDDLVAVDLNGDGADDILAPDGFERRLSTVLNQAFPDPGM